MNNKLLMGSSQNPMNRRRFRKKPALAALIISTILLASCPEQMPNPDPDPDPDPTPTALAAPTDLAFTTGNGTVTLTWTAVTGASSYRVYRDEELIETPSPITATTYTDTGLTNGTNHNYTVRALSNNGTESPHSTAVTATLPLLPKVIELHTDNSDPQDIWSDGTTMYVTNNKATGTDRIFAYNIQSKTRDTMKEFDLDSRNTDPRGIWSDANMTPPPATPTIWVIDPDSGNLFAYTDGTIDEDRSLLAIAIGNNGARGIWANGTTMWATDRGRPHLFAYLFTEPVDELTGLPQDTDNEASNLLPAGTNDTGIWSNGTTMWILSEAGQIYAYTLNTIGDTTPVRETDKEFTSLADGNTTPRGIWSDGTTMWVLDGTDGSEKIYAYTLATRQPILE